MNASRKLIQALTVALELTDTTLSDPAITVMLADLSTYPERQVLDALKRCCRELKPRQFSLAGVLERIDDGRPDPEGAWASIPKDEASSVVWTTEMRDAAATAAPHISAGDLVAGRMAFLEAYRKAVQQGRDAQHPVEWEVSLGHDKNGREMVVLDAARKGRISLQAAQSLLPHHRDQDDVELRLRALGGEVVQALAAPGDAGKEVRAELRAKLLPKRAA